MIVIYRRPLTIKFNFGMIVPLGSATYDVTALGGGGKRFRNDSAKALRLKSVTME